MKIQEMKIHDGETVQETLFDAPIRFSQIDLKGIKVDGEHVIFPYAPANHAELFGALTCEASESGECPNTPEADETKTKVFLWLDGTNIPVTLQIMVEIYPIQYTEGQRQERLQFGAECNIAQGRALDDPDSELADWKEMIADSDAFYAENKEPEYQFFNVEMSSEEKDMLVMLSYIYFLGGIDNISFSD